MVLLASLGKNNWCSKLTGIERVGGQQSGLQQGGRWLQCYSKALLGDEGEDLPNRVGQAAVVIVVQGLADLGPSLGEALHGNAPWDGYVIVHVPAYASMCVSVMMLACRMAVSCCSANCIYACTCTCTCTYMQFGFMSVVTTACTMACVRHSPAFCRRRTYTQCKA